MRLERLFFVAMIVAAAAVLASIVIINHPPLPEPAPQLECTEWTEHRQIRKDYGPTKSAWWSCAKYEWRDAK
jgi:hypothetical protein